MRPLRDHLGDPGLHLLAIALIIAYLALGRGSTSGVDGADAPLPSCKACRARFLPGGSCERHRGVDVAHVRS